MTSNSGVETGKQRASGSVVHVAVVHGPSQVYFIVAGDSREEMLCRLAARLEAEVTIQLWKEDSERFKNHLARGQIEEAVDFYFSTVGRRWDSAWLSMHVLSG